VLAHLPCGQKGVGMKSPDNMAVFACSACHAHVDSGRRWGVNASDYLRALAETQSYWIESGLMKVSGVSV
jgi:acetone carboxylase gamma subunit